jgi:8-oxo-dGTP pyrophosphatase MutT (NUDIX family)
MVQLWYPAARTAGFPRVPYIPARSGRSLDAQTAQAFTTPVPAGTFHALRTHSFEGAPVARPHDGGLPVILFSPGDGMDRSSLTGLAEELASHGFLVAGIDHTHDAGQVEFPGGRVEVAQPIPRASPRARTPTSSARSPPTAPSPSNGPTCSPSSPSSSATGTSGSSTGPLRAIRRCSSNAEERR